MPGIDWIQGQKFKGVADFVYAPEHKLDGDYDNLQNTFDITKLKDKNIVYTHTMYVNQLFDVLYPLQEKFIVVTHNSDVNIDDKYEAPDNVIRWFSQNVNVYKDYLDSLPIGLENDMWFPGINKKQQMQDKLTDSRHYHNLVYMNHNIATNPSKREYPYQVLEHKSWVTSDRGANGYDFGTYIDNIYNHLFVICPEGNGIDTHRIWECLYMGVIPIVENNINNSFYTDLPMLVVDDWDELTEEGLMATYLTKQSMVVNRNKLYFRYWEDRIKSYLL